jgi:N-acetylmuramoyl-L-alanine amidase
MNAWLTLGARLGIKIEHRPLSDAGAFTGGGRKIVWHTTEGDSIEGAYGQLKAKNSASHFLIDPAGTVIQMIALNRAARSLAHPSGPETNRANAIQVECVGHAASSGTWPDDYYTHLADLFVLTTREFMIENVSMHPFKGPRLSGDGFFKAYGHVGHIHAPGNSHWDPGPAFRIHYLQWQILLRFLKVVVLGP